jgi:hypothetical protein
MSGVLFLFPLFVAWIACFCLAREVAARKCVDADWRISWVLACLGFGSILTIIVEASSLMHSLNRITLASLWCVTDVILFFGASRLARKRRTSTSPAIAEGTVSMGSLASSVWMRFRRWPVDAKCMLLVTVLVGVFLFFVALLTACTNIDSLAYHLGRMGHWIQQESVDHFPTDDLRQIEFGPWSSFLMTNLFLLWGSDRLLNLVQWFAMASTLVVLTWISDRLGNWIGGKSDAAPDEARRSRIVAFTCLLAITVPIGLVESISTQNDYTTAFWLSCLFAIGFLLIQAPTNRWYVGAAALSCGLGVLTKATTYMYAAPLILAGGTWWFFRAKSPANPSTASEQPVTTGRAPLSVRLHLALLFVGLFFLLNLPHMARNFVLFGSPLGSSEMVSLEKSQHISPAAVASNLIRGLALHANTNIPWLTHRLNSGLNALHRLTGKDLNDPATTLAFCRFYFLQQFKVCDSLASCPIHVFMGMVACGLMLAAPRRNLRLIGYCGLIFASILLFCAGLKWQIWQTRLHLAWFLLLTPAISIVLQRSSPRWIIAAASVCLLWFGAITLEKNASRPVFSASFWSLPREKQYFTPVTDERWRDSFLNLADALIDSKCRNIGVKAGLSGMEYPLWVLLRNRGFQGRIDRCYVENVSANIRSSIPRPEVIVTPFDLVPKAVSDAYPHVQEFDALIVRWAEKPVQVALPDRAESALARLPNHRQ